MQILIEQPALERYVEEQVKAGRYPTAEALVADALHRLQDEEAAESSPEYQAYLRARLAEAQDDIKNGRVIDADEKDLRAMCEDVKARGRERIAAKPGQP